MHLRTEPGQSVLLPHARNIILACHDEFPRHLSLLWDRICEGLNLYGIDTKCVRAFATFRVGPYRQRTQFSARVTQRGRGNKKKSLYAFVLGDAAFNVSLRAGRGLNTGIKAALSLSTALSEASDRRHRSLRDSDFLEHNSFMNALQDLEVRIRTLQMMMVQNDDAKHR